MVRVLHYLRIFLVLSKVKGTNSNVNHAKNTGQQTVQHEKAGNKHKDVAAAIKEFFREKFITTRSKTF